MDSIILEGIDNTVCYLYNIHMTKAISVTLPEKLILETDKYCDEYMMTRSELIKNALVQYIKPIQGEIKELQDAPAKPTELSSTEQDEILDELARDKGKSFDKEILGIVKPVSEIPQEPTQPELPPKCDFKFCNSRSTGKFKIITNDGTEETVKFLCVTHLGHARREGEVKEL